MILPKSFYTRDDVVQISKDLLGKLLCTRIDGEYTSGTIVETEAYRAPDDRACHAFNNKITERTKTMFMEGGTCYVYISYGIHRMINIVTSKEGEAHAILIRAIQPIEGSSIMIKRRKHEKLKVETVNGPGKTAKALGVGTEHDGSSLLKAHTGLWIEDQGFEVDPNEIAIGPRVGMSIHTRSDAHRPWRFSIRNNKWVSKPKKVKYPVEWLNL